MASRPGLRMEYSGLRCVAKGNYWFSIKYSHFWFAIEARQFRSYYEKNYPCHFCALRSRVSFQMHPSAGRPRRRTRRWSWRWTLSWARPPLRCLLQRLKKPPEGGLFNRNKGYQLNVKTGDIKSDFSREWGAKSVRRPMGLSGKLPRAVSIISSTEYSRLSLSTDKKRHADIMFFYKKVSVMRSLTIKIPLTRRRVAS